MCRIVSVVLLMWGILLSVNAFSITLNLPEEVDERDVKYKDWVLNNKEIPPVSKRNPDPSKGPRIPVKEIKIQGVKSYPDLSISKQELAEIVEKKRYDMMDEEFLQKSGYTIQELLELAEVLNKIDKTSDEGNYADLPEIQKLIWLLKEQKKNRGLTLGEIEEIAEEITTYYRNHGFFLAKAFLPSQDVHDGVVGLTVLEGVLGKVTVAGNDLYGSDYLIGLFDDLINKAVIYKDIEQKLYLLNDYPGLKVTGYFKPGDQIGDTHLNINVVSEKTSSSLFRLDNHGSEFTGQNRLYYQYEHNTPVGYGDKVSLGIMRTSSPDNTTYGSINYRIPIYDEKNYLYVSTSKNQYILEKESSTSPVDLTGNSLVSKITYEKIFERTRRRSNFMRIELQNSQSEIDSESDTFDQNSSVDSIIFSYNYDYLSDAGKSVNNGRVLLSIGDFAIEPFNEKLNRFESFEKINFSHYYLKFSTVPFTQLPIRLISKFNLQVADLSLPSIEQSPIAGPDAVRAFPVTEFSADSSAFLGLEVHFNYPKILDFKIGSNLKFSNVVTPYVFIDSSYGVQNGLDTQDEATASLTGWGIGLELKYKNTLSGHLMFTRASNYRLPNAEDEYGDLIIIDMQYSF